MAECLWQLLTVKTVVRAAARLILDVTHAQIFEEEGKQFIRTRFGALTATEYSDVFSRVTDRKQENETICITLSVLVRASLTYFQ